MQEPTAAEVNDRTDDMKSTVHTVGTQANGETDVGLDGVANLDRDLRALTDGIAMLGRFELQLADYESSLGETVAPGG